MKWTEADWLSSKTPRAMLYALLELFTKDEMERKLRLYACSCVRHAGHLLQDDRSCMAIEVAERYADKAASREDLDFAHEAAENASTSVYLSGNLERFEPDQPELAQATEPIDRDDGMGSIEMRMYDAAHAVVMLTVRRVGSPHTKEIFERGGWVAAKAATINAHYATASIAELRAIEEASLANLENWDFYEDQWQANCLHCVFGNPFNPRTIEPIWRTDAVVRLAQDIYQERAFERMPLLGDALRNVGCNDEVVLAHCQEPIEHGLGCWVIDDILGKSLNLSGKA